MKLGLISDIHSNKIALNKVLEDMPDVDKIVCLGDIVGYGPWPSECVDIVKENCDLFVLGNHDRTLQNPKDFSGNKWAYEGIKYSKEKLTSKQYNWVTNLPEEERIENYRLIHSHPSITDMYVRPNQFSEMNRYLSEEDRGIFLGHTHIQSNAVIDNESIVVNPGSVGQPRDNNPKAAYSVVDSNTNTVTPYRVPYDIDSVITAVKDTELPEFNGKRLENGE